MADDWIRKRPLYQLRHKHCPKFNSLRSVDNLVKHSAIIIYDSRVAVTVNCPWYDSRVLINSRRIFILLGTVFVVGKSL